MYGLNCGLRKISEDNDSKGKGKKSGRISLDMAHTIDYVICILLSQGTNTSSLMRENICSQSNHSCIVGGSLLYFEVGIGKGANMGAIFMKKHPTTQYCFPLPRA